MASTLTDQPSRIEEVAASLVAGRAEIVDIDAPGVELVSAERPITNNEIDMIYRLAAGLSRSGMFKDARQADQAFAKLIFGRDLGLSATQAMTDIHIVEGKPEMSANLQAAKVRSSDRYEYEVAKLDDTGCTISFYEGEKLLGTESFTQADAERAKLSGKDVYQRYPRNMFFARCMSNGVAFYCPDVMNGIRVYADGEVQQAIATVAARTEPEPEDATVVEDPPQLTADELAAVKQALDAAEIDVQTEAMLLGSVGVESVEELTPDTRTELQAAVAKHITGGAS